MFKGMSFKLQTSLIDFGKNCPVADAKQLDKTKKAKDYRWIAPEIATGESTPSKASDIYFCQKTKCHNRLSAYISCFSPGSSGFFKKKRDRRF